MIRSAEGGVLFLDEIGELDLGLQAKLLRVIQENQVRPVGEDHEIPVDVRFLAATNRDLERAVAEGRFHDDLYHRLRALVVHLPPLRERASDYPLLVSHCLRKHSQTSGDSPPSATSDFLTALQVLDLPGNLRQLEDILRQCVLSRHASGPVELSDLPPEWPRRMSEVSGEAPTPSAGDVPAPVGSSGFSPVALVHGAMCSDDYFSPGEE